MSKVNLELTQNVFQTINNLGALCATPGIEEDVKKKANEQILILLNALSPELNKLSAQSNGIIV